MREGSLTRERAVKSLFLLVGGVARANVTIRQESEQVVDPIADREELARDVGKTDDGEDNQQTQSDHYNCSNELAYISLGLIIM